jgi:hypothetical protein
MLTTGSTRDDRVVVHAADSLDGQIGPERMARTAGGKEPKRGKQHHAALATTAFAMARGVQDSASDAGHDGLPRRAVRGLRQACDQPVRGVQQAHPEKLEVAHFAARDRLVLTEGRAGAGQPGGGVQVLDQFPHQSLARHHRHPLQQRPAQIGHREDAVTLSPGR